jgi:hypothetical protein
MNEQVSATDRAALRALWYEWTAIVELFARRRRSRRWLSDTRYRALHRELLRLCRGITAGDDEHQTVYHTLESTVCPWLCLKTLEQAEVEVLIDLVRHCRRCGWQMGGPSFRYVARRWVRRGALLAAVSAVAVLLAVLAVRLRGAWAGQVQAAMRAVRWASQHPGETAGWVTGGGLLAVVAIWLIVRAHRS